MEFLGHGFNAYACEDRHVDPRSDARAEVQHAKVVLQKVEDESVEQELPVKQTSLAMHDYPRPCVRVVAALDADSGSRVVAAVLHVAVEGSVCMPVRTTGCGRRRGEVLAQPDGEDRSQPDVGDRSPQVLVHAVAGRHWVVHVAQVEQGMN
jgi:hypothetical protein